jgi:transcriptional regulator with GAF, ATPase, and Fis domain/ABC-type uncharacterized transport system substrate-binding protein
MVMTARAIKIFSPGLLFLTSCLALLLAQHHVQGAPPPPAKKVLLVYAYQSMLPAIFEWDESIRAALQGTKAQPVEFYTEFLDLVNFTNESYRQNLFNFLRDKYSNQKIDLLIPVGSSAFSFLKAQGNAIFPGTPIVFCYVPKQQVEALTPLSNSTGVIGWVDVQGTLAAALKLHPGTRRVVLVAGASEVERTYKQIAREALRPYEGRFEIAFLTDMPLPEILKQLANLPAQTLIIYLSVFRDSTGQAFVPREVAGSVAQAANAPVYGLWENLLGQGIVGGHLTSFKKQGRLAGEIGRRVLNGEKPENLPPVWQGTNFYGFDWRQLKRWGIDERQLPPGSVVRFKEESLWHAHRKYIIATILFIFFQGTLIFFLWAANARRRRAEDRLTERLAIEERLAEFSARFVDVPVDRVDFQISDELKKLGDLFAVDSVSLFEFPENNPGGTMLQSSTATQVQSPPQLIEYDRFTWIRDKISHGQIVRFNELEELPPEATAEIAYMQSHGIKSAVLMPVTIGQKTWGVLSFAMLTRHRKWLPETVQRYNAVAQIIALAISGRQSRKALLQSKNFNRAVLDSLAYHIAVLDRQGTILDVNESWMRFARENDSTSLERIGRGINYLEVCRRSSETGDVLAQAALEGLRSVLEGSRTVFILEYPCDAPKNIRWFMMRVIPFSGHKGGVIVSHIDITEQKLAQIDLQTAFSENQELKKQLEAETAYLKEEIRLEHDHSGIIGQSAAIQYVLYKVDQVSATDTTVLVLGENGTGKELVCRAIHSHSPRNTRPLIKVNCAALPANLIESELFGHERGAFTGAQTRRAGRFEVAHGGALFLDEIGELPLELQGKLLRVLEDGEFERLGSSVTMKVDVRVIAATNRDLEKQVHEGFFREDLYYRLNVFPITVPPLRERPEDIPQLTRFFVEKSAKRLGKTIKFIPQNAMERLQEYRWPGNVRELQNVIERAVITSTESKLQLVDDLRLPDSDSNPGAETMKSLQEIETRHIVRVLEKTNWRIDGPKGAAMILKVNPSTLRSRMRKLRINKP